MDDDDDTHVCLKCRATISGLDNYVAHRKSNCCKQAAVVAQVADPPADSKADVDVDPYQSADNFFSCLELQSSVKKSPLPADKTRAKADPASADAAGHGEFLMEGAPDADVVPDGCLMRPSGKNLDMSSKRNMSIVDGVHLGVTEEEEDEDDDYGVEYGDLEGLDDAHGDYPPRSHGGGKWSRDLMASPPGDWELIIEDCADDTPPPHFTGGKWKPSPPVSTAMDVDHTQHQASRDMHSEDEDDAQGPPPGHTSGKWVPGKRPPATTTTTTTAAADGERQQQEEAAAAAGAAGVWCEPCQRRLSSAAMYKRHVRSGKHRGNCCPGETTTEGSAPGPALEKRLVRKSQRYSDSGTWVTGRKSAGPKAKAGKSPQKWKWRRKCSADEPYCDACGARVQRPRLGQHLLSPDHMLNMQASGRYQLLLDNMDSVVRLAPFQCAPCSFYCNDADVFVDHWRSEAHLRTAGKLRTNNAGPRVRCGGCDRVYRYNVQLRLHLARSGHTAPPGSTASDEHQAHYPCPTCPFIARSSAGLRVHMAASPSHSTLRFFCTTCKLRFPTASEAARHRSTSGHRAARRSGVRKKCPVCEDDFGDLRSLRDHMRDRHPDKLHRCRVCGEAFVLPRDMSSHAKTCTSRPRQDSEQPRDSGAPADGSNADCLLQCKHCHYRAKLKCDILCHESLHQKPVMNSVVKNDELVKEVPMYSCSMCGGYFPKASLGRHIRTHTQEKQYACKKCGEQFTMNDSLVSHMRKVHRAARLFCCAECNYTTDLRTSFRRHCLTHVTVEKLLACDICGKKFAQKQHLAQHIRLHSGKKVSCPVKDCFYQCRCKWELNTHMQCHSNQRPYPCTECDFSCKSKYQLSRHVMIHRGEKPHSCPHCDFVSRLSSQLRRHLRIHTGARPYHCPHCDYKCNVLENLRKHVLTTKKHAGKKLYECRFCEGSFSTDLVKSFRAHLFAEHRDAFQSQDKVMSYITGIYHGQDDPVHVDNPLPAQPKWRRGRPRKSPEKEQHGVVANLEELVGAKNVIYVDLPKEEGHVGGGQGPRVLASTSAHGVFEESDPPPQTTVLILDLDRKYDGGDGDPGVVVLDVKPGADGTPVSAASLDVLRQLLMADQGLAPCTRLVPKVEPTH